MKKFLALVLSVVMVASLAACGNSGTKETQAPASGDSETAAESTAAESTGETAEKVGEGVDAKDLKVGFIFIGDENEGYTAAHYAGAKGMQEALGLSDDQVIIKWNIPEDETCYDAAVDLADQGCNIIFANSFGILHPSGSSRIPECTVLPCNRLSGSRQRTFQYAQLLYIYL